MTNDPGWEVAASSVRFLSARISIALIYKYEVIWPTLAPSPRPQLRSKRHPSVRPPCLLAPSATSRSRSDPNSSGSSTDLPSSPPKVDITTPLEVADPSPKVSLSCKPELPIDFTPRRGRYLFLSYPGRIHPSLMLPPPLLLGSLSRNFGYFNRSKSSNPTKFSST
ncbi:hypothetical protein Salat_1865300 [Sesamum alatum]|uniref:Uncharacterized protein n=1 Tax=Sesamum alatum TaxID=300844 RepID=A0AAE1Y332_9LAMI|nr:hypothetical protein Salat_1865300 [Sesamum alatum]